MERTSAPQQEPGKKLLASYIDTRQVSLSGFARDVGAHHTQIMRLLSGARGPSVELAFAIEQATGGAVPASSWVEKKPRHARRLARRAQ